MSAPEWQAITRCDLCTGTRFDEVLVTTDLAEGCADGQYQLVVCRACRLHFLATRPVPAALDRIYPSDYEFYDEGAPSGAAPRWQRLATAPPERLSWLTRLVIRLRQELSFHYIPRAEGNLEILDVGCGSGAFLDTMRRLGWRTSGVEPVARPREVARAKGHDVRGGTAEELPFDDASFDVVYLSHVLEHTYSPRRALGESRRVLRPGGALVLAVPNYRGLQRILFRRFWSGLDLPRHFYQFDRRTLRRYLEEVGFAVERMWTRTGATSLVKTLRLMVNGAFATRWRRDAAALVALAEAPVFLSTLLGNLGWGRDVRVIGRRT